MSEERFNQHIERAKHLVSNARISIAVATAPLILLFSKLEYLGNIENTVSKILVSLIVGSLFVALSIFAYQYFSVSLMLLDSRGVLRDHGENEKKTLERLVKLDHEKLDMPDWVMGVSIVALGVGYVFSLLLLLLNIWC